MNSKNQEMEYSNIHELVESYEFKRFIDEQNAEKILTGNTLIDNILKDGIPSGKINIIMGKSNVESLISKFIRLNKNN
jgi:hypothetical protein